MGMYTSVQYNGQELQFKCGHDDGESYKLGDRVDFRIWPDKPGDGKLLDGAYYACDDSGNDTHIVVIEDHRIIAILLTGVGITTEGAAQAHGLVPYRREWWTEAAWLKKDTDDAHLKRARLLQEVLDTEREISFLETLRGLPDAEVAKQRHTFRMDQLAREEAQFIQDMMQEQRVLDVES